MANTSSRFVEQETFTPGPGAYQLRNLEVNGKSKKPPTEGRVSFSNFAIDDCRICAVCAYSGFY